MKVNGKKKPSPRVTKKDEVIVTVRIPRDIHLAATQVATEEERTRGWVYRRFMRLGLEQHLRVEAAKENERSVTQ